MPGLDAALSKAIPCLQAVLSQAAVCYFDPVILTAAADPDRDG
jgi:hypothetical protein